MLLIGYKTKLTKGLLKRIKLLRTPPVKFIQLALQHPSIMPICPTQRHTQGPPSPVGPLMASSSERRGT